MANTNTLFDGLKLILSDMGVTNHQQSSHWTRPKSNAEIYAILMSEGVSSASIASAFASITKTELYTVEQGEFEVLESAWGICGNTLYVVNPYDQTISEKLDERDRGVFNFSNTGILIGAEVISGNPEEEAKNNSELDQLIDGLLNDALDADASDIHICPWSLKKLSIELRIDGVLNLYAHDIPMSSYKGLGNRLLVRAKTMGGGAVVPLSLKFSHMWQGKNIQIRMEAGPVTEVGKNHYYFALRILNPSGEQRRLADIGFPTNELNLLNQLCHAPQGLVIVTGPTGSGKTTTLYSMLQQIQALRPGDSIQTLEDPVESELRGIKQTEINNQAEMTFNAGLRSKLRQDPDVILVGELRDLETARLAVQASMTGHLVMATIHTNSAIKAIGRLADLGVNLSTLADSLLAITAQRMVRKVCPHCCTKEEFGSNEKNYKRYGGLRLAPTDDDLIPFANLKGCDKCRLGYFGRHIVSELLIIDPWTQKQILNQTPASEIEKVHIQHQYASMWVNGISLVRKGITTISELEARLSPLASYGEHFSYSHEQNLL